MAENAAKRAAPKDDSFLASGDLTANKKQRKKGIFQFFEVSLEKGAIT